MKKKPPNLGKIAAFDDLASPAAARVFKPSARPAPARSPAARPLWTRFPLTVLPSPCATCPYVVDAGGPVFYPDELDRLRTYDSIEAPPVRVVYCRDAERLGPLVICRGWLTVHRESVAARLAVFRGDVTAAELAAPCAAKLYESGTAAADAGLARICAGVGAGKRVVAKKSVRNKNEDEPPF